MERKIFHYRRNLYRQEIEVNSQLHIFFCRQHLHEEIDKSKASLERAQTFYFFFHLRSFFTTSGAGLEAFFSSTGHLVVAVCNRKEYTTVTVPVCQLCDQTWVCSI